MRVDESRRLRSRARRLDDLVVFGGAADVPARASAIPWLAAVAAMLVLFAVGIVAAGTVAATANRPAALHLQPAGATGSVAARPLTAGPTSTAFTTLADAEAKAGFQPVTLAGIEGLGVTAITYREPPTDASGNRLGPPAIEVDYVIGGATAVQISTNATHGASAVFAPAVKASGTVSHTVESIGGNDYVLTRSNANGRVLLVGWQTVDGRTVYLNAISSGGLDNATLALVLAHIAA